MLNGPLDATPYGGGQVIRVAHTRSRLTSDALAQVFSSLPKRLRMKQDGTPDESRIMLVEVYTDQAAVKAHVANPRMPRVREAYTPLIDERILTMCAL